MRSLVSTLLAGVLLLAGGPTHAQITKEVSDVTGVTRLESTSMRSLYDKKYAGDHASFQAAYVNNPDDGRSWVLSFYGFTDDTTQVSRTNQFVVEADGARIEPIRLTSKTRSLDDVLLEIKRAVFTRSGFETIATARTVRVRVGPAHFVAVHPRRKDMRLILDRVSTKNPPTASSESTDGQ
jgi:hypothetical protein